MKKTAFRAQNTQWVNPTSRTVKFETCHHAGAQPDGQDARITIVIPPAGSKMSQEEARQGGHVLDDAGCLLFTVLSSDFDSGIHQRDESGKVVGGLAPQLRVYRAEEPVIEAALQPEQHALEQARKIEKEKQLEAVEAERQRLLAQGGAREAEEAKLKADAAKNRDDAERAAAAAATANAELAELKAKLQKSEAEKAMALSSAADANKAKAEAEALLASATEPNAGGKAEGGKGNGRPSGKAGG